LAKAMSTEHVVVVFRARNRERDRVLPTSSEIIPSKPGSFVARASRPVRKDVGGREWLVEVEVHLPGMYLDPEHWLRTCHGFLVDSESGEDVGVVDDVQLASGSGHAVGLVVATGWSGRHARSIAAADVQAIVPSERRLVVRDTATRSPAAGPGRT
jgi:sporulation protein YlmC with PRC-barrel domain